MTRTVLSLLLLITLSISCSSAGERPPGQDQHAGGRGDLPQRLEAFLSQAAGSGFAGSVLVARDGRVLLHKGYGFSDRQRTRPVEAETPFWVASISKQFTAAAILKLVEQGRLSLEDPIVRHFPDVPEDKRGITIHHLLSHTAGFRQVYAADGIADQGEAVKAVLGQALAHSPGQGFTYANDNYSLLAAIVEIASGQSYEPYLRENLFSPAGMAHTGFWGEAAATSVAEIHGKVEESSRKPNWGFRGGTGIYSTTGDLYRWFEALQSERVLSQESRRKLLSPQVSVSPEVQSAYGWFGSTTSRGTRSIWTRGSEGFGHNAVLFTFPEEKTVVIVASNAGDRSGMAAARSLAEDLEKLIFQETP